jgi:hypothetical protein
MIELTPTAQTRLNDYLNELRRVLSGSASVDPTDVERDVRDHIDAALTGQAAPVEANALDDVLRTLGAPAQWLPERESGPLPISLSEWISALKQSVLQVEQRLAGGPESYRLAYLSLFALAGGMCLFSAAGQLREPLLIPVVAALVSFVLARAALSLFGAERTTTAQKWLLYPSLVAVYLSLIAVILLMPALVAATALDNTAARYRRTLPFEQLRLDHLNASVAKASERLRQAEKSFRAGSEPLEEMKRAVADRTSERDAARSESENLRRGPFFWGRLITPTRIVSGAVAAAGLSWLLVGAIATVFPGAVRAVFHPFARWFSRRAGMGLTVVGLLMSIGGLAVFFVR